MTRASKWILAGLTLAAALSCGDDDGGAGDGDSDADSDADGDGCGTQLEGGACTTNDSCTWLSDCGEGRCDCPFGEWTCAGFDSCTSECPVAQETPCGSACSTDATDCLCSCGGGGGGFEFAGCACEGGTWECLGCGG